MDGTTGTPRIVSSLLLGINGSLLSAAVCPPPLPCPVLLSM